MGPEESHKEAKRRKDNVNPGHYVLPIIKADGSSLQVIDIIEALNLNFHVANAVTYILRTARRDDANAPKYLVRADVEDDINKAVWYLQRWLMYEYPHKNSE